MLSCSVCRRSSSRNQKTFAGPSLSSASHSSDSKPRFADRSASFFEARFIAMVGHVCCLVDQGPWKPSVMPRNAVCNKPPSRTMLRASTVNLYLGVANRENTGGGQYLDRLEFGTRPVSSFGSFCRVAFEFRFDRALTLGLPSRNWKRPAVAARLRVFYKAA